MAKPIDHDVSTGTNTMAWEAAKGAAKGWLAIPVGVGVLATAIAALAFNFTGGSALAIGLAFGAGTGYLTAGPMAALAGIGALLGLTKGSSRISMEKDAFNQRRNVASGQHKKQLMQQLNAQHIAGMQEGFGQGEQIGFSKGAQVGYLKAMEQQEALAKHASVQTEMPVETTTAIISEKTAAPGTTAAGAAAIVNNKIDVNCECPGHADKVVARRNETAAAAAITGGVQHT